jgi:hypothetical protein
MQSSSGEEDGRPGLADMKAAAWQCTFKLRFGDSRSLDENNSPTLAEAWASHTEPIFVAVEDTPDCPKPSSNLCSA